MRGQVYLEFLELFSLVNFLVNQLLTNSSGNPVWHHFTKNLLFTLLGSTGLAPDPEKVPTRVRFSAATSVTDVSKVSCLTQSMATRVTVLENARGEDLLPCCLPNGLSKSRDLSYPHGLNSMNTRMKVLHCSPPQCPGNY